MIWLLAFIAVLHSGELIGGSKPFNSLEECNAAKVELTANLLKKNIHEAGMTCTLLTIGQLT